MSSTFGGVDRVRERVHRFGITFIPLKGYFGGDPALLILSLNVNHVGVGRTLTRIEM